MTTKETTPTDLRSYFLITLVLSVPFLVLGAVASTPGAVKVNLPLSALMAVCPVTAAAILTYRRAGWAGVRALLARAWDAGRVRDRRWFLPAVLAMPLILALSYLVMRAAGLPLPGVIAIPWLLAPVYFLLYFAGAVGEELGWTAYATDPLQARFGWLRAGLLLGAVWAAWHIIPYLQAHNPPGWIVWQCIFTVASRVLMVWIYNHSGKSTLTAVLYHAMYNLSWSLFPNNGSHYDPLVVALITIAAVVGVAVGWGARANPEANADTVRE